MIYRPFTDDPALVSCCEQILTAWRKGNTVPDAILDYVKAILNTRLVLEDRVSLDRVLYEDAERIKRNAQHEAGLSSVATWTEILTAWIQQNLGQAEQKTQE